MEALQEVPCFPPLPTNQNPGGSDRAKKQPGLPASPAPITVPGDRSPALPKALEEAATAHSSRSNAQAWG